MHSLFTPRETRRSWLVRLLQSMTGAALMMASTASATELTFEIEGFSNFSKMSQAYGDRVTSSGAGNFAYGTEGGWTPNVEVSYGPSDADPAFWTSGYGDLENVLFEDRDGFGRLEITFTADAGYEVHLQRWEMAAYTSGFSEDPVIDGVQVRDGEGQVLYEENAVRVSRSTRTVFDHGASPLTGRVLILSFDSGNLGNLSDDIAMDHIVFSQSTVSGGGAEGYGLIFGDGARARFEGFRDQEGDCHEDFDGYEPGALSALKGEGVQLRTTLGRHQQTGPLDLPVVVLPWNFVTHGAGQIVGTRTGSPDYIPEGQNRYEIRFDSPRARAGIERVWNTASVTRFYHGDVLLAEHRNTVDREFVGYVGRPEVAEDWVTRIELDGLLEGDVYQVGNSDDLFWSKDAEGGEKCVPTRLTWNPGNERRPEWDPRGGLIAFAVDGQGDSWSDIGGVAPDGSEERLLAEGQQAPFGIAGGMLGWVGASGQLITNEALGFHEYLAFDVALAPFTRTETDGDDVAFTRKLWIDGGGGGGFLKVSRDGSTALWRFSRDGGGGRTTIHTAPYQVLDGQSAGAAGVIHVDIDSGEEQRYLQGAAMAPDGSYFILSQPAGDGSDLWKYVTDQSEEPSALTTSGQLSGVLNRFPDVSPDGRQLVFASRAGGPDKRDDIFLLSLEGGDPVNLTETSSLSETWPSWAPDGKTIAYGRNDQESSPTLLPDEEPNWNIYTLCLDDMMGDGGDGGFPAANEVLRERDNTIAYERITTWGDDDDRNVGQMEISADGSKIIYSTRKKNIYTMNADGSDRRLIFSYSELRGGCPCLSPWVAISPDGSKVAWTDSINEIFTANSEGTDMQEIATAVSVSGSVREPKFGGGHIQFGGTGKIYYQLYMGRTGESAAVSGLYEVNPDGTGVRKLFGFLDLWSVVPKEPDQSVDPGDFDVSDDGRRMILDYDLQDPSGFFGPGAIRPGAMVTWEGGNFHVIQADRPEMNLDVEISGDGRVIAYQYRSAPDLFVNTFAGTSERSLIQVSGFNIFDFRLNADGSLLSADTGGTEGSYLTTLLATDGVGRLDLMPASSNATAWLVRMTGKGDRLVWSTTWNSPEGGGQIWRLDVNPTMLGAEFPQITDPAFLPNHLQQDGSSTAVFSARFVGAADDTWFVGMFGGELRRPSWGGIGRFSFEFFDDGEDNDPVAADGHYHTKDVPAFRQPELGIWTIRMGARNGTRVMVTDVPGMRVIDGLPEEVRDSDGDGVSDLLEEAFGADSNHPDDGGSPWVATSPEGEDDFFGVEFTVGADAVIDAENRVEAGAFLYCFELSDDLSQWREAGGEIIISLGAPENGRVTLTARLAEALVVDACFVRVCVRRKS